ncbi:hypothetical protein GUA87_00865 [Sneathiella sp. P13V-1]|uniref:thioesterase family protein n=1 Tax=Sneathiella sp. P13V-1 TaxID=2697366 RepID=UPI00187B399E|nr:thioesterase family protein [Sneathiella sp. P13V-1]MBE7635380.1 hypothetical protein [Sneathiella sp. P13V-1]
MTEKLIPSYRGAVEAWECDQMDHMNVQFYSDKASAALAHLLNALGLTPARIREEGKTLRYKNLRIQYKAELRGGSLISGVSGIRSADKTEIRGFTNLYNTGTSVLSCNQEFALVYQDLKSGEIEDIPDDILEAAKVLCDEHVKEYAPKPIQHTIIPATPLDNMFETNRSAVDVWECDLWGNIETKQIVARFSDAASHIMAHVGITRDTFKDRNLGSAALDYYMEFHNPIKESQSLVLKSGLLDRMEKLFVFGHQLIDCDTGKVANTTTVLGCYFDMTKRKSVQLPEEYRRIPEQNLLRSQL